VPIANEKIEGPTTILKYLGLTIDTQNMVAKIPADKVKELLNQIKTVASANQRLSRACIVIIKNQLVLCKNYVLQW
jgi:hypothetical protein